VSGKEDGVDELDIAVRENRRLLKEVLQLRQQVAAFESSRWWRLHPRLALRRLRQRLPARTASAPQEVAAAAASAPPELHPLTVRFRDEVVAGAAFSEDWFTENIRIWEPFLRELEGRCPRILEIGSFEGLSACFLLWRLPDAQLTCVDTFAGIPEYVAHGIAVADLEAVFDENVSLVDDARVRKLVGDSRRMLLDLVAEEAQFDLVYVDGSHLALDVVVDAALAWPLLVPGGILIFDDYTGDLQEPDALLRPGPAIDAFLGLVEGHYKLLLEDRQLIARKTGT